MIEMIDYNALYERIRSAPKPLVIAIDGRAASGKSTLSHKLSDEFGAAVIHTDDFFLPPEFRTEQRLSQPGGNVHYERFAKEVIQNLNGKEGFSYGVFDCSEMAITKTAFIERSCMTIIEGAYSCHPYFGDYADLRIFLTVEPNEQLRRIAERNGGDKVEIFKEKWIPMEEHYFKAFSIKEKSDYIFGEEE